MTMWEMGYICMEACGMYLEYYHKVAVYTYIHMYVRMCGCMCVCTYIHPSIHPTIHPSIHPGTETHTHMHTHTREIYLCIHSFVPWICFVTKTVGGGMILKYTSIHNFTV